VLALIAAALVVFLMLVGFALTYLLRPDRRGGIEAFTDVQIPLPAPEIEDFDAKHRATLAAFRAPAPTYPAAEVAGIEQFLARLVAASTNEDASEFHDLINHRRMFEQVKRSGILQSLTQRANESGAQDVRNALETTLWFRRFRIAEVTAGATSEEVVVYLHGWRDDDYGEPMRLWLARDGLSWKVFDWERLRLGLRRSTTMALQTAPTMLPQHRSLSNIQQQSWQFERLVQEGNREEANAILQQAQLTVGVVDSSLEADQARVIVADALLRNQQNAEAFALYKAVRSPERVPGSWYGQAICLYSASRAERALEEINRFEQAVGPVPLVHRLRADLLTMLKRPEATEEWMKVRQVDPQADVLESLAIALAPDQLDRLAEFLDRAEDPASRAEALLSHYRIQSRFPIVKWLADYVESHHPDSARAYAAQATVSAAELDYDGAMRLMKQAIAETNDDEKRTEYVSRYRNYGWSAGKELELLETAEAPKEVFTQFVSSSASEYEEDAVQSSSRLKRFVQKYLEKAPDDPDAHYALGEMFQQDEKLPEAEAAFQKATLKADPDLEERIMERLQSLAIAEGKTLQQYRASPTSEKFVELAEQLRWTTRTKQLAELVDAHRMTVPNDPSLLIYDALVAQRQGRFNDAYLRYRSLLQQVDPETQEPVADVNDATLRAGWLEAAAAAGRLREVYEDTQPPGSTFEEVASRLRMTNDWSGLQQILALHGLRFPGDPQLAEHQLTLDEHLGNHAAVVLAFQSSGRHLQPTNRNYYYDRPVPERYFRSLLLMNRKAEAIDYARECDVRLLSDIVPALGLIAAEDVDGLLKYLWGHASPRHLVPRLYAHTELGRALRTPLFRKLRDTWPPNITITGSEKRSVVLTSKAWMPQVEEVQQFASKALGVATVEQLPQNPPTVLAGGRFSPPPKDATAPRRQPPTQFLVSHPHGRLLITFSPAPYIPEKNQADLSIPAQRILEGHHAWIGVADLRSPTGGSDDQSRLHGTMLADLLPHDGVGLYSESWVRLVPADDELLAGLKTTGLTETLFQGKRIEYLFSPLDHEETESGFDAEKDANLVTSRIKSLAEAYERRKEGDRFRTQVAVETAHAREILWSTILGVEAQEWGGYQFRITPETASRLDPHLAPGEPFEVHSSSITDYEYTHDGKVQRASDPHQE
jgi:tetratricopeptide (TPR) repeat protein